jgi:predicted TIM-barrel fold metal-dependent hydrolase
VVFATDTPLGPIAPTLAVIDGLDLDDETRRKIYVGNAERLINRKLG